MIPRHWQAVVNTLPFPLHSFLHIHQDNIISDLADIAKGNDILPFPSPEKPQMHPGPGTIKAVMHPVFISKSTSPTKPRRLQSFIFMTSFCLRSQIVIFPLLPGSFISYPYIRRKSRKYSFPAHSAPYAQGISNIKFRIQGQPHPHRYFP